MTPESPGAVSEACQLLAAIAADLPARSREELARLLGHSVAMPSNQELREMRLGLLVETITRQGEIPTSTHYDNERERRLANGEDWPRSTGLAAHYGTWTAATRAATDLAYAITPGRIRAATPRPWPLKPYTRTEIREALERASRKVGQVIGQWEYAELRRVERQLAARLGHDDPRLPTLQVIHKHFGSWEGAITAIAPASRARVGGHDAVVS